MWDKQCVIADGYFETFTLAMLLIASDIVAASLDSSASVGMTFCLCHSEQAKRVEDPVSVKFKLRRP